MRIFGRSAAALLLACPGCELAVVASGDDALGCPTGSGST
jgi:hypothetical protein